MKNKEYSIDGQIVKKMLKVQASNYLERIKQYRRVIQIYDGKNIEKNWDRGFGSVAMIYLLRFLL